MATDKARQMDDSKRNSGSALLVVLIVLAVVLLSILAGYFFAGPILDKWFPELKNGFNPNACTQLYYSDGSLLSVCDGGQDRKPVPLSAVPKDLQNAFVATEDVRFFHHFGIDPVSMLRAVWWMSRPGR